MIYKRRGIALVTAAVMIFFCKNAMAKSDSLIGYNIDKMRDLLYEDEFKVYRASSPDKGVYYGAKFEPYSGTYLGTPYNVPFEGIENAVNTEYEWLTLSDEIKNENCPRAEMEEAVSNHTSLVGFNWNFASKEAVDLSDYSNYIYNFIDALAARGEDILLIFGKEMNIDDNFLSEDVFIDAFRLVAEYAHTKENIAMVWAPNDTGGLDTTLKDFYPGDEYVDWIGCSLYSMPYFQGNPNASEASNIGFIMGPYSNPVMRAKVIAEFMEENSIQKPVIITEGGIGYESPGGEQYIEWASQQLRRYYGEIVRRYPQFKCIISFNNYVEIGDYYRYDFGSNPTLLEIMRQSAKDPIYLTKYPSSSEISYEETFDGMDFYGEVNLSAYAYRPKAEWLTVSYEIDGMEMATSVYPPYNAVFDEEDISYGEHELKAILKSGETVLESKTMSFKLSPYAASYIYSDEEDNGSCPFLDMENSPAEMRNAAGLLYNNKISDGDGNNNFMPDKMLTRAETAAFILRMLNIEPDGGNGGFDDVTPNDWFFDVSGTARRESILEGYEDNTFRGNDFVTKEQFAAIAARILQNESGVKVPEEALTYYDAVSDWAYDYINICKSCGILLERYDNKFEGSQPVKRGDAAVMLARLYGYIK